MPRRSMSHWKRQPVWKMLTALPSVLMRLCDKPTKRRPELEGGERVAVAAVLTDERVEGGVDELVAELADDRRHDQVVDLQLLVVVLCGQWGDSIARFGWSCWTIWLFTLFIATREREEEESPMLFSGISCSTRPAT